MTRVYLSSINTGYLNGISRGFEWLKFVNSIKSQDIVSIKPNLTFPNFRKGVMTNPECLEALIQYLKNFTKNIIICESDSGGYNRFFMDDVFKNTGIKDIAKHYGVRIINLSQEPSINIPVSIKNKEISVPFPRLLYDETDLFITVPVPKIHMNTINSISIKNQWGIIPDPSVRLKLHPYFKEVIYAVNKTLPKSISIVDGKYGLTRSGPMQGDHVDLNWILMSDNLFYADFVVTKLMRLNYEKIPYLKYIFKKEEINSLGQVNLNTDITEFICLDFYLKRKLTDYPGLFAFKSEFLSYLAYHSPLSNFLHKLLYLIREPFYDYDQPENTNIKNQEDEEKIEITHG